MKKKIIGAAAGLTLVLVIVLSLVKGKSEESQFPTVDWVAARTMPMEETISASGEFKSQSREIILSEVAGKVKEITVEEGDWVKSGQVLLYLDQTDYAQQVRQAEATLESIRRSIGQTLLSYRLEYSSREIELRQTRERTAKQEELFKLEAITEEELKLSRDALERAEQSLRATAENLNLLCGLPPESPPLLTSEGDEGIINSTPDVIKQNLALEAARRNLDRCLIRAPRDGQIVKVGVEKGALLGTGTQLIIMQGDEPMEAVVTIDEVDIGKIREGDTALVSSDSLIGEEITGQIRAISPILEKFGNTRAGKVTIAMGETDLPLRAGASCVAEITTLASEAALTIPVTAVATGRGRVTAFRMEETGDGRTRLNEIELAVGISTINDLEVLEGVAEGDRFALSRGDTILRDGLYVIPAGEEPEDESEPGEADD